MLMDRVLGLALHAPGDHGDGCWGRSFQTAHAHLPLAIFISSQVGAEGWIRTPSRGK